MEALGKTGRFEKRYGQRRRRKTICRKEKEWRGKEGHGRLIIGGDENAMEEGGRAKGK